MSKARQAFSKGCALGTVESCDYLSVMMAQGQGGPKNVAKARPMLRKACKRKFQGACAVLTKLAGVKVVWKKRPPDPRVDRSALKGDVCQRFAAVVEQCRPEIINALKQRKQHSGTTVDPKVELRACRSMLRRQQQPITDDRARPFGKTIEQGRAWLRYMKKLDQKYHQQRTACLLGNDRCHVIAACYLPFSGKKR